MSERSDLLASIADTIKDYRAGEIPEPTPDHVDRWINQFDEAVQVPLLREIDHVFKQTFFSKETVIDFLKVVLHAEKLVGDDACEFWEKSHFLNIQKNGHSQEELLNIFDEILRTECGISISECGDDDGDFIYIDDVIFSGGRVRDDLSDWIRLESPPNAHVHVIAMAIHTGSEWVFRKPLTDVAVRVGKRIEFKQWRSMEIENQKINRNKSEVLWPCDVPDNAALKAYMDQEKKFPFEARNAGGKVKHKIFSSEEGRQLLERELLLAGIRIRSFSKEPSPVMRPLGFGGFGLGFGSTIVTFRNCPNNCPPAFWWGDPTAAPNHPFSKWYPLLPRKTYEEVVDFDDIDF